MSAAQQALDAVLSHLSQAVAPTAVSTDEAGPVVVRPAALARTGRSRRDGSLLDLELTLLVTVEDARPLPLLESLLLAAESYPRTAIGPLPDEVPGLGFSLVLPVAVPIPEPTGPPVSEVAVELHRLTNLTGEVLEADGRGVPGAEVTSSTTRQRVRTGAAGDFALIATGSATTITATKENRTATAAVEPGAEPVRLVLPEGS